MKTSLRIAILTPLIIGFGLLFAQAPKETKPAKPPAVPMELQRDLFKAASEQMDAQRALEATPQFATYQGAMTKLNALYDKLRETCGSHFVPAKAADGLPICAEPPAKPEAQPAPKPEGKK